MFKKKDKSTLENQKYILLSALLIHAAKMDENYTDAEKNIIKKAVMSLSNESMETVDEIFINAEKKEKESNQIIEFTKEIKKNDMDYRCKVIEILWKIIYSDGVADIYESNLMRRISGLLYVSDKEVGEIKQKIKKEFIKS